MVMDATAPINQLVTRRNRPGTSAKVSDARFASCLTSLSRRIRPKMSILFKNMSDKKFWAWRSEVKIFPFSHFLIEGFFCIRRNFVGGRMSLSRRWIALWWCSNTFNS